MKTVAILPFVQKGYFLFCAVADRITGNNTGHVSVLKITLIGGVDRDLARCSGKRTTNLDNAITALNTGLSNQQRSTIAKIYSILNIATILMRYSPRRQELTVDPMT